MRKVSRFFSVTATLAHSAISGCVHDVQPVGPVDGAYVVPTAQTIRPAGDSIEFAGRPVDLALSADGDLLFVKNHNALAVIDTVAWKPIQELPYSEKLGASMHGIAVTSDASRVYVTTAQAALLEGVRGADGSYEWARTIPLPGTDGREDSQANGISLLPWDENFAVVCLSLNNALAYIDLPTAEVEIIEGIGIAPYDVEWARNEDGYLKLAYVSNYGGRRPTDDDATATSGGTPVVIDERGIASTGTVSVVNMNDGIEMRQIAVGLHPSDLELSEDGSTLFVANVNSDTVTVIKTNSWASDDLDTVTEEVVEAIAVKPDAGLPFGSAPNALTLSDGKLYVANGGNNAVGVFSFDGFWQMAGFIPAGWYPAALESRGDALYVANAKGVGSRSQRPDHRGLNSHDHRGTVTRVRIPTANELADYTAQVHRDARIPQALRAFERSQGGARPVPVPKRPGDPSVFDHIVYIIKENRTYDQVFGDLPQGDGDPELCVFGREVTPNHHAIAEQFVLLDNYYCNGVLSADGHSWATEGYVTDHLEKSFGGFTRSYTFGDDPLTYSSSGFIWDNVLAHGLSFRNYGEMDYATPVPDDATFTQIWEDFQSGARAITFTHNIGIENLRRYSHPEFPGWNMRIPDVLRAEVFIKDFAEAEHTGEFPNFVIIYLPQDHGSGTKPDFPTPRAHTADNDLAVGRIVEALSHSRFWPKMCIYINEDDPQDGFDHVDGHRSLCLVISPYTKRRNVISKFYNQTSVLHTIALQLGMPPMNQLDSASPVMHECFARRPDFTSYDALPANIPLDERNPPLEVLNDQERHWAELSLAQNFEQFDRADEDTLNRIIWHSVKGVDAPYPSHFAGAHATGLRERGLVLTGDEDD